MIGEWKGYLEIQDGVGSRILVFSDFKLGESEKKNGKDIWIGVVRY